ncbi:hypothetical protein D3C87_1672880 [compost metagenome]
MEVPGLVRPEAQAVGLRLLVEFGGPDRVARELGGRREAPVLREQVVDLAAGDVRERGLFAHGSALLCGLSRGRGVSASLPGNVPTAAGTDYPR